jgi:hypothetical protein
MEPESGKRPGFTVKGSTGLVVAIAVVAILLIALPAYRLFFLIRPGAPLIRAFCV